MKFLLTQEGQDEYEKDGFVVDDVEEEERADSDEERQRKKKRKKKEDYTLDEDDYELLKDNNITIPHWKQSKKSKRLKRAQEVSEEPSGLSDEEEMFGSGNGGRTAKEKLKQSLFGDDEGASLEDIAEEEEQAEDEEDGDIGEEDEMDDFIVDEENEHGAPPKGGTGPKKGGNRRAPGVSLSVMQEAHEIFGDVDELLQLRKQDLDSSEWRERKLEDEFEPIVLSEKCMTEEDEQIQELDVPERMQIYEEITGSPPLDDCIVEESNWIHGQLQSGTVLWAIQDLDRKWLLLQKQKSALQSYYNKRFEEESQLVYDVTRLSLNQQLFESIMKSLKAAGSEMEVDDVDSKFNLHFPPGKVGLDEGQYKRPKRKSLYSICSKAGLWVVASKFGYSSEQFGLQLSLDTLRNDELEDPKETPEEMASNLHVQCLRQLKLCLKELGTWYASLCST
ncbi:hypothetical protein SO802_031978 [Lithocarpus litseifolius]|uniref:Spt6 acidic N-terminal domain-containing protein n=1 Tax=Lithocarpus litseifolius TaxID=425828 RepID=A0AAW2BMM1_9ROSI